MVLASGGDRKLLGWTPVRRAGGNRLARYAVRNGDGNRLEHHRRGSDQSNSIGPRRAGRRGWQSARRLVPALRGRSHVVGRSCQGATATQAAALLTANG